MEIIEANQMFVYVRTKVGFKNLIFIVTVTKKFHNLSS